MVILSFRDYQGQAERLAQACGLPYAMISAHRFPDEEVLVRLPESLPPHIVICRSLDRPDPKLIELLLACQGTRAQGVQRITLVAPYLCYMRQDVRFHPGEVISQRVIGEFLAGLVDELITIDPHLHRTHALRTAIPAERAMALSASSALGNHIATHCTRPLLLGPDSESRQWVQTIAQAHNLPWAVAEKTRLGDHRVEIQLPPLPADIAEVVLIDDVISSGHTLLQTATQLKAAGIGQIRCAITHALFAEDSYRRLQDAGIGPIWSTDSIPHASNAISLTPLLADALQGILNPGQ